MSWEKVKLSDVCDIIAGQSPQSIFYNKEGEGKPFFQGKADFNSDFPSVRYYTTKTTKTAYVNDILLSVRAPVGPTNICNIEACIGRGLAAIRPKERAFYKYVYHYFKYIEKKLSASGNGSTFSAITTSDVKNIQIPLPPLTIQKQIAEILDKADALRKKDLALLEHYNALAQSLFIELFGDPVINEKGWKVLSIDKIVKHDKIITYGIVQAGEHVPDGVPYIRTGDIKEGRIVIDKLLRTSEEIAKAYKRSEVNFGDIIMSIRATVGTVALLPQELDGANLTQGTARISPGPLMNKFYLFYYLQSEYNKEWINRNSKGATFKEITLTKLRELPVQIPPIVLQNQFATQIQNIELQKEKVKAQIKASENLFQSLLQKAFNGGL